MNIETKQIKESYFEYLNFGWKHTQDVSVRSGPHHRTEHILARDRDMNNYVLVVALENKYFNLKKQLKTYQPAEAETCLLLFILLVFPLIIYLAYKSKQKKEIESFNIKLRSEMLSIAQEAKSYL